MRTCIFLREGMRRGYKVLKELLTQPSFASITGEMVRPWKGNLPARTSFLIQISRSPL